MCHVGNQLGQEAQQNSSAETGALSAQHVALTGAA